MSGKTEKRKRRMMRAAKEFAREWQATGGCPSGGSARKDYYGTVLRSDQFERWNRRFGGKCGK